MIIQLEISDILAEHLEPNEGKRQAEVMKLLRKGFKSACRAALNKKDMEDNQTLIDEEIT